MIRRASLPKYLLQYCYFTIWSPYITNIDMGTPYCKITILKLVGRDALRIMLWIINIFSNIRNEY